MIYRHYTDAEAIPVEAVGTRGVVKRVVAGPHTGAPNFVVRVFTVEQKGYTPHHMHPYEHGIVILEGEGKVLIDKEEHRVSAGSVVTVPPNMPHQVVNDSDSELVLVCVVPAGVDSDALRLEP